MQGLSNYRSLREKELVGIEFRELKRGVEGIMKKLDPRSVIIGFLMAVIGTLSMGFTEETSHFNSIEATNIVIKEGGKISFAGTSSYITPGVLHISKGKTGLSTTVLESGIYLAKDDSNTSMMAINKEGKGFFAIANSKTMESKATVIIGDGNINININNDYGNQVALIGQGPDRHGVVILADKYGDVGWSIDGKNK